MSEKEKKITPKQELFCYEYCVDFNATRAAIKAGFSEKTSRQIGSKLLTNVDIQSKIEELQANLAETAGISALKIIIEHKKIAFSSAGDLREGWMTLKQFNELSEEQKACIQEISTKSETRFEKKGDSMEPVDEEWVKIKLYDKQKSLDCLSKMLGFDAPQKVSFTDGKGRDMLQGISFKIGLRD